MAFIGSFVCQECMKSRLEIVDSSGICIDCRDGLETIKEDAHMAKLARLPLKERIRRIELALYRLDAGARLDALEVKHVTY